MTTQVPTRFQDDEPDALDALVALGVGASRSDVIRVAVAQLSDQRRRWWIGETIAEAYRRTPQTAEDDALAMANAIALTEAEPW